ncbi:hypothetical protein [Emticicia agri]|uniref:Uncharacterized protein n=1 Tax=Emticicia agri TaxID=2492393 RepID=A0A4Q5M3R7_9BACT|nr:hypothetical protein [Emticicia agri]RYU97056.1 hypothetical protein EWM59_03875 [Emticicia agri]
MKKLLLLAVLFSVFAISCGRVPYIYVEKSISHTKDLVYTINTTGSINQTSYLSMDELVRTLTEGLDGQLNKRDYTIKELVVQSAEIKLKRNTGNTALSMNISSLVANNEVSVSPKVPLLRESNIEINEVTVAGANFSFMNDGLDKINNTLANAIKRLYRGSTLIIDIKGSPLPVTARVAVTLTLSITFNMQYSYCEESLFVIDGKVCP